jgi:hypothetical protein
MNLPGTGQFVGVGETNILSLMVGEVEVITAQPVFDPVGDADQGRTLNILANRGMAIGRDDGAKSFDVNHFKSPVFGAGLRK